MEKTAEKTVYISMGTVNQNREFGGDDAVLLGLEKGRFRPSA